MSILRSFHLLDGDTYAQHPDFYWFCDEHKIGRANLQKGMKDGIFVISCGKHKGKCFSWADAGVTAMQAARELTFSTAHQNRSKAVTAVHTQSEDRKHRRTEIELTDPTGKLHLFNTLTEANKIGPQTSLQNVKNKTPYTFLHGPWAGWMLLKFITTVR